MNARGAASRERERVREGELNRRRDGHAGACEVGAARGRKREMRMRPEIVGEVNEARKNLEIHICLIRLLAIFIFK